MAPEDGPLVGLRVVELAGLGPAPHAAMMLAGLGADVIRIDRPGGDALGLYGPADPQLRGRRIVSLDLKQVSDRDDLLRVVDAADVLIEGLRPGVAERLGIGPDNCLARNPRLVFGRITGWGQTGPMSGDVGHDINYVGLTGALHAMGSADRPPTPPLNLVGDYGGGSMLLLVGILAALVERQSSGRGQVIDAAMVDGAAILSQLVLAMRSTGAWSADREANLLDGGAPFYATYTCADGRFVAVGALEPRFFAALAEGLGLDSATEQTRWDRATWPHLREQIAFSFAADSRDAWVERFAGTDACVTPVLDFDEAARHPHLVERGTYSDVDGVTQSSTAPRFSRSAASRVPPPSSSTTVDEVLAAWAGAT
jgi:alpha-methylacyl-CoA racemase